MRLDARTPKLLSYTTILRFETKTDLSCLSYNDRDRLQIQVELSIRALKRDNLRELRWHAEFSMSDDNILLLYATQSSIKLHQSIPRFSPSPANPWLDDAVLSSCKETIALRISEPYLSVADLLLHDVKKVKGLHIHDDRHQTQAGIERLLADSFGSSGLLSHLTSLTLRDTRLNGDAAAKWSLMLAGSELRKLCLDRCPGTPYLLQELTRSPQLLGSLTMFTLLERERGDGGGMHLAPIVDALNVMQEYMTNVQKLSIDLFGVNSMPYVLPNCTQLRWMSVHASTATGVELRWDSNDLAQIMHQFSGLRQLSCSFPRMACGTRRLLADAILNCLQGSKLRTLNISPMPTLNPSLAPDQAARRAARDTTGWATLQPVADQVFGRLRELRVLGFGSPHDKVNPGRITFIRNPAIDAARGDVAIGVTSEQRRLTEPESDVMDFEEAHPTLIPGPVRDPFRGL